MTDIIYFPGPVLTAPDRVRHGLWSVDGKLTFSRPAAPPERVLDGWVLPGFADAHCHIGLGPAGPVEPAAARDQALADLNAGTLLVRDAVPMAAALDAACWAARTWLGADNLAEGARADVVVCREDPRAVPETIRALEHVVLGGRIIR